MKKYNLHISLPSLNKLLLLLFFFSFTLSTFAATRTWDGSESSDWNTKANWVGNKVPGSKDKVIIPTGLSNYPIIGSGDDITAKEITINSGGSLQIDDGILDISKIKNSGIFVQNGGTVSAKDMEVKGSGTSTVSSGDLSITGKLKVDGGTFTQSGGTVETNNFETKNSGTYNQPGGTLLVDRDFKVSNGTTFNSTGGLVQFTGSKKVDYKGDIQFHDIIIDDGVDPDFDKNGTQDFYVSGDYTNNNPDLDVEEATFIFNGTSAQSISSASTLGKSTFGTLEIDNSAGVNMQTDLEVKVELIETAGTINLNGNGLIVGDEPVPVELTSFTASKYKNGIMLNWSTATEVNNYGFEIERASTSLSTTSSTSSRAESREWVKIAFVEGHGNSNSPKDYSLYDKSPLKGKALYRLKQIDTDGAFEYSNEVEVSFLQSNKAELFQNHPNPFNPSTIISFNLPELSHVSVIIYNAIGQEVMELVNTQMDAGFHNINFNGSNLSTGFYFYRLETPNYTKTMKMMLIK